MYNGEAYLAECIESVLKQTYHNWEYLIVDNCSTDQSLAIAKRYADKDKRIRIHCNTSFLTVMENHNHALRLISKDSKYCKIVHADDWLFPECLERMVGLADENQTVGIVSAYRLENVWVGLDGLPYNRPVIPGHELCRSFLLGGPYVFGSPNSLLYRSDLIHQRERFYKNESRTFSDVETCLEVLQESDFGFVHQVLTYTRRHAETAGGALARRHASGLTPIYLLTQFGRKYLNNQEYEKRLKEVMDVYYHGLARSVLDFRAKEFWRYQKNALKELGFSFSLWRVVRAFLVEGFRPINMVLMGLKNRIHIPDFWNGKRVKRIVSLLQPPPSQG